MVVLVERHGATARDRRGSEPECEPPVVGFAELRCEKRPDRSDDDERAGPLARQRDDRLARRRGQRHAARAERKGDAAIDRDRVRRWIGEGHAADRIPTRPDRSGDLNVERVEKRALQEARVGCEHGDAAGRDEAPDGERVELGELFARSEHEQNADL